MGATVFLDTNILLYLLSSGETKARLSERILDADRLHRFISTQVIGEFIHVARRKASLEWEPIREFVTLFHETCRVGIISPALQELAMDLAERYRFSWYDSLILASALESGADTLLTEDLRNGQEIGSLTIRNPFASPRKWRIPT